jgi:phosphoribosylformylglycinamidine cyclo-ligase
VVITYKDAGVSLDSAETSTRAIADLAKSTFDPNVMRGIGLFSGFYSLDLKSYPAPVIVSSIDGVGTKLKIAFQLERHDTVGQDLVNHCVNDIMTSGADPLFFLDYIGTQRLDPKTAEKIVWGMAKACRENGCALIGGETAEMPGFYLPKEYDLAGAMVGVVNRKDIIDGSSIDIGDALIGLPSNGLHTNGYSLARKVLLEMKQIDLDKQVKELGACWGEILLKIHRSYASVIKSIRKHPGVRGISHITGGGIEGNTRRLLRKDLDLFVDWQQWEKPAEFSLIQKYGEITDGEMRRVFNMGIGMIFVVQEEHADEVFRALNTFDRPIHIGSVVKRE